MDRHFGEDAGDAGVVGAAEQGGWFEAGREAAKGTGSGGDWIGCVGRVSMDIYKGELLPFPEMVLAGGGGPQSGATFPEVTSSRRA